MNGVLVIEKSASVKSAIVGDSIQYTIKIVNDTGEMLQDVMLVDSVGEGLEFIAGSVQIDGMRQPRAQMKKGIEIGDMGLESCQIVTFRAKVIARKGGKIGAKAVVSYSYFDFDEGVLSQSEEESDACIITIEVAELRVTQRADQVEVSVGDIIQYRIVLSNLGTLPIEEIRVYLGIPLSGEVQLESFRVKGEKLREIDLEKGIPIGSLDTRMNLTLDYEMKVVSGTCSEYLTNEVYAEYGYTVMPYKLAQKETERSRLAIPIQVGTFKQLVIDKVCEVTLDKPDIEEIDDIDIEVAIENTYVIRTIRGTSHEGQKLSGYKLMVHGCIKWSIEYTALLKHQPMYLWQGDIPFSQFIILPPDYHQGMSMEVSPQIENLEVDLLETRAVWISMSILLSAKVNE